MLKFITKVEYLLGGFALGLFIGGSICMYKYHAKIAEANATMHMVAGEYKRMKAKVKRAENTAGKFSDIIRCYSDHHPESEIMDMDFLDAFDTSKEELDSVLAEYARSY